MTRLTSPAVTLAIADQGLCSASSMRTTCAPTGTFGICLGHQTLSLAMGGETYK